MVKIATEQALKVVVEPSPRASLVIIEYAHPFSLSLISPRYVAPQPQSVEYVDSQYCASAILWTGSSLQVQAEGHTFEIKEVAA